MCDKELSPKKADFTQKNRTTSGIVLVPGKSETK
jgi:hypothetical protein